MNKRTGFHKIVLIALVRAVISTPLIAWLFGSKLFVIAIILSIIVYLPFMICVCAVE